MKCLFQKRGITTWPAIVVVMVVLLVGCQKQNESSESEMQQATIDSTATTMAETPEAMEAPEPKEEEPEPAEATTPNETQPEAKTEPKAAEMKMVPIEVALPKPMFIGTPQNLQVPNLEKPLGKPRPPFLAPAGTKNVALNKRVTSSDEAPIIGEIAMITDGDKEAGDGSYVELGPFLQHVTVDLGAAHDIYAILVWHFHKQPRIYYDVIVQASNDPAFKSNVTTLFNNDLDNSAGLGKGDNMHYVETAEGKLIDAKGVQARYIRCYSNGNSNDDLNHYIEVAVYGRPAAAM